MRRTMERNWWLRAVVGAGLLIALIVALTGFVKAAGSLTDQRILVTFLISLTVVVGMQVYIGNTGIMSFGHAAFMAVGAYGAALFTALPVIKERAIPNAPGFITGAQLGFFEATLIGILAAVVLALLVGPTIVRLSGAAAAVATIGIMVVVYTVLSNAEELTRGAKAFAGIPPFTTAWQAALFASLAILAGRLLRDSDLGLGMRASRADELAARASGVNIARDRLVLWVASAAIAGMGGVLYAHFVLAILPKAFHFHMTFTLVTMVIVGGQSISGAVLGTALVSLVAEVLRRAENGVSFGSLDLGALPGLTDIVFAILIIATMTLRPKGLMGRWELDELMLVRAAKRRANQSETSSTTAVLPQANTQKQ